MTLLDKCQCPPWLRDPWAFFLVPVVRDPWAFFQALRKVTLFWEQQEKNPHVVLPLQDSKARRGVTRVTGYRLGGGLWSLFHFCPLFLFAPSPGRI